MERWNKESFEKHMYAELEHELEGYQVQWKEQIKYPIISGGKRFRPALVFNTGVNRVDTVDLYRLGCAVEILHSATLVHDDLPSVDDDDYRRGKLTAHKVYGEGLALTGADFMFFLSQKIISSLDSVKLCGLFSKCAMDTAYGEALDIEFENHDRVDVTEILRMYELKTARLIQFAMCSPLVLSGAGDKTTNLMWEAGKFIGLSFQLLDDLKDVKGSFTELGKTPGKDILHNKHTVIKYEGLDKTAGMAEEFWKKGFEILEEIEKLWANSLLKDYLNLSWDLIKKS